MLVQDCTQDAKPHSKNEISGSEAAVNTSCSPPPSSRAPNSQKFGHRLLQGLKPARRRLILRPGRVAQLYKGLLFSVVYSGTESSHLTSLVVEGRFLGVY